MRVSSMARDMTGSAILQVAREIRGLQSAGHSVVNFTVGDFDPQQFPVPELLSRGTTEALRRRETNYPPSDGMPQLRKAVAQLYREWLALEYPTECVLITAGARPAIYALYRVLIDPGDRVVFGVPSWNAPYYSHLTGAQQVPIVCDATTSFLPTRSMLEKNLRGARLLALNSPLNPSGTAFDAATLQAICDLVLEENARRGAQERPLYLLYDQIYWMLTFGDTRHVNPVSLRPDMNRYTVLVDGISKCYAATGMRVGWALGPSDVIASMSDLNGHIGAWAPRAEQVATTELLGSRREIEAYHAQMKPQLEDRLNALYRGMQAIKRKGLPVDAFPPAGAIYLSARFALIGRRTRDGQVLKSNEDIRSYLLRSAGFAAVAFQAFGVPDDTGWFRLSVGAVTPSQIESVLPRLEAAIAATQV